MKQQETVQYIDYSTIQHGLEKKLKQIKRRKRILLFFSVGILLIFSCAALVYGMTKPSQANLTTTNQQTKQEQLTLPSSSIVSFSTNLSITSVMSTLEITSSQYLKLKHLHIKNEYLTSLKIQLQLQSLVVQNSKLVEFSYNSTELKYLKLINNNKMTSFVNSTLMSLTNLTISKSNINTWHSNTFGHLKIITLDNFSLKTFPELTNSTHIDQLVISYCAFSISSSDLQNNRIKQLKLLNSTHQGGLSISNTQYPQSIVIQNTNLLFVNIENCSSLSSLSVSNVQYISYIYLKNMITPIDLQFDNVNTIGSIQLINITILDLQHLDKIQNIIDLELRQVPLQTFKSVPPSLKVLCIDYKLIKDKKFNISSQKLSQLDLQNYQSIQIFNTKNLVNLQYLTFHSCSFKKIEIEFKNMYSVLLWDVKGYEGNDLEIYFKGDKINKLTLSQVQNLRKFENHHLDCDHLTIIQTSIQRIENNIINTFQMIIQDNQQMQYLGGNVIQVQRARFNKNQKLDISQQIFQNLKQVTIQHCGSINLDKIEQTFPALESLVIVQSNVSSISNVSIATLKYLQINDSSFSNFTSNNLPFLIGASLFSNLTTFINNNFTDLSSLNLIQGNTNLNFSMLIEQLTSMKQNNNPLTQIELPSNVQPQTIDKIKILFPDAKIVVH